MTRGLSRRYIGPVPTRESMKTIDDIFPLTPGPGSSMVAVLVVDDEVAVRRFTARVLEREGYTVLEAADGVEALEVVEKNAAVLEIVISDVVMPRLNGVELMQKLATSNPDLPFILMSGYAMAALAELGIAVPCSILPKPFSAERLLEEVRRCIRPRA
jgi:two-component system cell cycle sensor histidine kinase/response regulator CckA